LLVRFTKWSRAVTYIAFVSAIVELRRKWTCTKLTNPTHGTRTCDNPLFSLITRSKIQRKIWSVFIYIYAFIKMWFIL